jgi:hypothetical protein
MPADDTVVTECLARRDILLLEANLHYDVLLSLKIPNVKEIGDHSVKQSEVTRKQCLCLRKPCEFAIQQVNKKTGKSVAHLPFKNLRSWGLPA